MTSDSTHGGTPSVLSRKLPSGSMLSSVKHVAPHGAGGPLAAHAHTAPVRRPAHLSVSVIIPRLATRTYDGSWRVAMPRRSRSCSARQHSLSVHHPDPLAETPVLRLRRLTRFALLLASAVPMLASSHVVVARANLPERCDRGHALATHRAVPCWPHQERRRRAVASERRLLQRATI